MFAISNLAVSQQNKNTWKSNFNKINLFIQTTYWLVYTKYCHNISALAAASAAWCYTVLQVSPYCPLLISPVFPKRGCQSSGCPAAELPTHQKTLPQATHNFNHTMKTEPSSSQLWSHLSWVQRQTSTAHRWCLPVNFALIIQSGLYLTGLYWKVKGLVHELLFGSSPPWHTALHCSRAALPAALLSPYLFSTCSWC